VTSGTTLLVTASNQSFTGIDLGPVPLTVESGATLTIANVTSAAFTSDGAFTNKGTITIDTSSANGIDKESGNLTNSGSITIEGGSFGTDGIYLGGTAFLTNSGTVTIQNSGGDGIINYGNITNDCSGTINILTRNSGEVNGLTNNGKVTNSGTLTGTVGGVPPVTGPTCSGSTTSTTQNVSSNSSSTQSESTTQAVTSSTSSGGGGVPEFPFQPLIVAAFTLLIVGSYLLVRSRGHRLDSAS
jgi:hypothetical protein